MLSFCRLFGSIARVVAVEIAMFEFHDLPLELPPLLPYAGQLGPPIRGRRPEIGEPENHDPGGQ